MKSLLQSPILHSLCLVFISLHMTAALEVDSLSNVTGMETVQRMRSVRPAEDARIEAFLKHRDAQRNWTEYSLTIETRVEGEGWRTTYSLNQPVEGMPSAYRITWTEGRLPVYQQSSAGLDAGMWVRVPGKTPLFGTAFYLSDIGLEFLFWPYHKALTGPITMRRGREAREIVSTNANPDGVYASLRYWVDKENFSILQAEAFDARGNSIKSFEPDSIVKVNGRWRVKELQMKNKSDNTRSSIIFDYSSYDDP